MHARGLHIILTSVAFGILVWFSVAMSDQYQVVVAAPLAFERIPEGKALATPVPPALELRLRGTGWRLASILWTGNLTFHFPMQLFHGGKGSITRDDIVERLAAKPGIQLVDMSPESVYIALDRQGNRTVPVALDCQLSFKEGYGQVGPTVVTPESVVITGSEKLLQSIDAWSTVHASFDNVRSPIEADLALAPSTLYQLSFSTERVHMRLDVEPFAEKTLSGLPVDVIAVAPNRELILIPPKIDVVVRGGIKQLSNLSVGDFHVSVNYQNILADSSGVVEADVDSPSGIQVVSKKPDKLQYVVRRKL